MKITDKMNADGTGFQKPEKVKSKVSDGKSGGATSKTEKKTDHVSISGTAVELNKLKEVVNSMPDVRADKVEALKNSINSGTYNVKGGAVAGKLLTSTIIDGLIVKE